MDRRTLLAISLCFLIFFGWQKFYLEPQMKHARETAPSAATVVNPTSPPVAGTANPASLPGAPGAAEATAKAAAQIPFQALSLPVGTGTAEVGNGNHVFSGWDLKTYRVGMASTDKAISLGGVTQQPDGELAFSFEQGPLDYLANVRGTLTKTATGAVWNYEDANIKLTRQITAGEDQPQVGVVFTAEFKTKAPQNAFVSVQSSSFDGDKETQDRQLMYFAQDSAERVHLSKSPEAKQIAAGVKWIGATNRYFVMTVINADPAQQPLGILQPIASPMTTIDGKMVAPITGRLNLVYPIVGQKISIPLKVYFGPKELNLLRSVEPTMDRAVDFGWFNAVAYPLLRLMKWFYSIVGNWGLSIILLTLLVKLALFPLTYKSMKSMKTMAKLQPQLARIREKYKDDKEALNREMLTLMRSNGYNPAAGCLPILVQMPVFFALYRVLYSSIELYHAPFAFWIKDLSAQDPFYVTPVLLTGIMFIQQKLTPNTATDPAQAKMMQYMPVIFGVFMLTLPSGLTLYMLINALASIAQQMILNKKLDMRPAAAAVPART